MKLYRLITGKDDAAFCRRITALLNKGWELHGTASISAGMDGNQVAQAVVKEVANEEWSDEKDLRNY
ncbi:MAG TPA: DUF1737 domain-containing protein [Gammaproteobacteria bacterium]